MELELTLTKICEYVFSDRCAEYDGAGDTEAHDTRHRRTLRVQFQVGQRQTLLGEVV